MNKKIYNEICNYFRKIVLPDTVYDGHVYTVGGCNRDIIMGLEPHDIDICIDLVNGGISFAQYLYEHDYLLYEPAYFPAYGTSSFILKEFPDITIEAVMTRKEQYKDENSRNPETVFGTIEEDAIRRDLTINSIYYNISKDCYFDPNNGQTDINNKIIRTPQDPEIIFDADPLRILRVIRFSLRFNDFKLDTKLKEKIIKKRNRLSILKQERITSEINKIFEYTNLHDFIYTINQYRLSEYLFPELSYVFYVTYDTYVPYEYPFKKTYKEPAYYWALIIGMYNKSLYYKNFMDSIKITDDTIEFCKNFLKRMKYSNADINNALNYFYIWNECVTYTISDTSFRRMEYLAKTKTNSDKIYAFVFNMLYLYNKDIVKLNMNHYNNYIKNNNESIRGYNIKLPINGKDIMDYFNIPSSPDVKKYLNIATELLLINPLTLNSKEKLLSAIKPFIK